MAKLKAALGSVLALSAVALITTAVNAARRHRRAKRAALARATARLVSKSKKIGRTNSMPDDDAVPSTSGSGEQQQQCTEISSKNNNNNINSIRDSKNSGSIGSSNNNNRISNHSNIVNTNKLKQSSHENGSRQSLDGTTTTEGYSASASASVTAADIDMLLGGDEEDTEEKKGGDEPDLASIVATSHVSTWHSSGGGTFAQPPLSFDMLKQLGEGANSIVYLGKPTASGSASLVTLKCMQAERSKTGQSSSNEWLVEKEMLIHNYVHSRDSANTTASHGWYEDKQRNCFVYVSEFCEGRDLFAALEAVGYKMSEPYVKYYMRHVAVALSCMHGNGIIHRDVKLENVIVPARLQARDETGVKLIDFGSAIREEMAVDESWRRTGGTNRYQAPELLNVSPYGVPIDMWALGVCIFAMLCGRFPFEQHELADNAVQAPMHLLAHVSPGARDMVARLLDRVPGSRISAKQMLAHPWMTAE